MIGGGPMKEKTKVFVYPGRVVMEEKAKHKQGFTRSKRGKIQDFSPQARARARDDISALDPGKPPKWFLTLGFPDSALMGGRIDSVMEIFEKAFSEIRRYCTTQGLSVFIRADFEFRKNASHYKGRATPHLHLVFFDDFENPRDFKEKIITVWLKAIGAQYWRKDLAANMRPVADPAKQVFSRIRNPAKALRYITQPIGANKKIERNMNVYEKYRRRKAFKKNLLQDLGGDDISLGRQWWKIGNIPFQDPIEMELTETEANTLKRSFRKLGKAAGGKLSPALRLRLNTAGLGFFMFMAGGTALKLIQHAQGGLC